MENNIDESISFEDLILLYEENEFGLEQVPQNIVNRYGFACLANALMFKEPEIPQYKAEIKEFIQNHTFKTLNSLINYIQNLNNDIDKLFAIFSYAALNIEYDMKLFLSGKHKSTTLEEVFETKKAVCAGYSIFFEEMAKRVNIDTNRIVIKEYSNFSKGYGYDPINPPDHAESDHASIYIEINNVPFISEPTWAAGHITDSQKFEWNFRPELFLIPLYKSLCDHYPCDESKQLLQFKFKYHHFTQAIKLDPFGRFIKTESSPYVELNCSTGYIKQQYSCIGPIESVSFTICFKKGNIFVEVPDNGIASYEIIQTKLPKHPNRSRFITHILFPKIGTYLIKMFINTKFALKYYVNNSNPCKGSIPLVFNPFHYSKFIAIKPKRILTTVQNGLRLICFAVDKNHHKIKYEIMKLKDPNSFDLLGEIIDKKFAQYVTLEIPFNNEFYENQLCVTFPSNGRYSVSISFKNEDDSKYYKFVRYFFDVSGVNPNKMPETNPIYYLSKGRKIAPIQYYDKNGNEILIKPSLSMYYVEDAEQTLLIKTNSVNDDISFALKQDQNTVARAKEDGLCGDFRRIKWTIPENYGEYHLKGWVNGEFWIDLTYFYGNLIFKEQSQNELKLLDDLRDKINSIKLNSNDYKKLKKEKVKTKEEHVLNNKYEANEHILKNNKNTEEIIFDESQENLKENEVLIDENDVKIRKNVDPLISENKEKQKLENEKIMRDYELLKLENEKLKRENEEKRKLEIEKVIKENEVKQKLEIERMIRENEEKQIQEIEKVKREYELLRLENDEKYKKETFRLMKENEALKIENEKLKSVNEKQRVDTQNILKQSNDEEQIIENDKIKRENEILKSENEKLKRDKEKVERLKSEYEKNMKEIEGNENKSGLNTAQIESKKISKCCLLM